MGDFVVPTGTPEAEYENALIEIESLFPTLDHRQPLYLRIRELKTLVVVSHSG